LPAVEVVSGLRGRGAVPLTPERRCRMAKKAAKKAAKKPAKKAKKRKK
jgi:hypothetical protein